MDIDELTISPKPPSSGMITDFETLDMIIKKLKGANSRHRCSVKVVIFDDQDFDYDKKVRYPEIPFFLQVGKADHMVSDNERLIDQLLQKYEWLVNKIAGDNELGNVKVLPQLHTLIWRNRCGV